MVVYSAVAAQMLGASEKKWSQTVEFLIARTALLNPTEGPEEGAHLLEALPRGQMVEASGAQEKAQDPERHRQVET